MAALAADLSKPIEAIYLSDGRVLKNATITAYRTMDVTVKYAGGSTVIRYEFLPDDIRPDAEKKRPGGPRYLAGETAAAKTKVQGQVFITTQGAGAYKFSNVTVYAFPIESFEVWKMTNINPVQLPKPLAKATTDADGKFSIDVPKGPAFFLFAQASRMFSDGSSARYEWHAPSGEFKRMDQVYLSAEWRHPQRPVQIDETP